MEGISVSIHSALRRPDHSAGEYGACVCVTALNWVDPTTPSIDAIGMSWQWLMHSFIRMGEKDCRKYKHIASGNLK